MGHKAAAPDAEVSLLPMGKIILTLSKAIPFRGNCLFHNTNTHETQTHPAHK